MDLNDQRERKEGERGEKKRIAWNQQTWKRRKINRET